MSVPGVSAHGIMLPEIRKKELAGIDIESRNPRHAAVMMLLYPVADAMHLVLILRPQYEGVHSGQVALPGGKVEPEDTTYHAAALRETYEEVGVAIETVHSLKELTKVYIPPSNFWVHPFVGYATKRPDFVLQEEEVAAIIEIPIDALLDDANITSKEKKTSYAQKIEVPAFELGGYVVWGATAMMLSELKNLFASALVV